MSGCFGGSAIDRWMEGNLNRYLDSQDEYGERTLTFKLWKGKKLIETWQADISNEDGCTHEMHTELVKIHTVGMKDWLNSVKENHTLVGGDRKCGYYVCDQETFHNWRLFNYNERNSNQSKIVENWSMLPKISHICHSTGFNIYRMGKYSITCFDTLKDQFPSDKEGSL